MKKVLFARRLSAIALSLLLAAFTADKSMAAAPTENQVKEAVAAFPGLKDSGISKFKRKDGARQATVTLAGGKRATLVGYFPKGKNKVYLALVAAKATIRELLGPAVQFGFDDVKLRNVTLLLVPPGDNRAKIVTKDLPRALGSNLRAVTTEFRARIGLTLFARLDAKPVGVVGDALKLIGLSKYDDITIQATAGAGLSAILKKKSRWNTPFQLRKVNNRPTYLEGLTVHLSGNKKNPKVAGWGQVTVNRKNYFLFAQYSRHKTKLGKAYGINAKSITLQSMADFAVAMPWARGFPTAGLDKLPLDQVRLSNPNYKPFDTKSDTPPAFQSMILVAASPFVKLPDRKTVSGTAGLIKGTPGPFLYANAAAKIFGQRVADLEAVMDINGLKADAKLGLKSVGPIKFAGGLDFALGPKGKNKSLNHEITLTGRTSLHGLPELSLSMAVDRDRMSYSLPGSCPVNPLSIKGSVPTGAGLVLSGVREFKVEFNVNDCYSKAIMAAVKGAGKAVDFAKDVAEDQIALGASAAVAIGNSIVNADKALKSAWKGSINAGQTAVNTVQNLDRKISSLGREISKADRAIKDLSKSIASIGKSIARAFTGITGLKKKRKKKKRERSAQRSRKKKLEQKKRSASAARSRAQKALGKVSPYFNADVIDARTTLSGLRFERKLAAERRKYATRLKSDFASSASKRQKLIAAVNADAIIAEFLSIRDEPGASVNDLNKRLREKRDLIEERIVTAAFDKAMDAHLSKVQPDPEPDVPFGVPVRIVGEYNMCLEAYRGIIKPKIDKKNPGGGKLAAGGSFGSRSLFNKLKFRASTFRKDKLRINHCHTENEKPHDNLTVSTQRFMMTPAGKLLALFGWENVCFEGSGTTLSTTLCKNTVNQVFFYDPTISAIRPMLAKKGREPSCIRRRHAARAGAQVQLSNCAYTKSGNDVEAPQKWLLAKWTEPLPKKVQPPLLNSLWTNYDRGYRKAAARIDNGMVTIDGMIKIRAADQNSRTLDFNEPIDVLPPAMRPDKRLVFNANSHGTLARVDILPNGRVLWKAGQKKHAWISLDNISYPAKGVNALKLNSGCKRFHSSEYRAPSYQRSASTVMLSGLITCTFNGKRHIATLPSGHRPEKILTFSINAHAEAARIEVRPNGKVWWITGGGKRHGWVSLDGIAFTLPGTKEVGLPLTGNCKRYHNKNYNAPTIVFQNGLVRISGLVDCPFRLGHGHNFAVLPKNMRPAKRLVFALNAHEVSVRVDVRPDGKIRLQHGWRSAWRKNTRGWISLDGIAFAVSGAKNMALKW